MGARLWNFLIVIGLILISIISRNKDDDNYNKDAGTFTDSRDGHVYKWIKVGDQIWMAENLAYGMYDSFI